MSSHRLLPRLLLAPMLAAVLLLTTGCFIRPGRTDHDTDIVSRLKIEIPKSATNIVGHTDKGVDFLMPNDQWRDYVAKYYPGKTLSQFPYATAYEAPAECIPAFRSGAKLVMWVTGDEIQFRKTDHNMRRSVSVTPDCEAGKALVQWRLRWLD
ncbi:hypothetical protein ACAG26_20845 [Mycobacterium sp. pUA109]|uniref:hypothetical protein n=1 Tax=Mycobacterium sp. pUA109 TaxID=3238982 RepID=UPI00351B49A2